MRDFATSESPAVQAQLDRLAALSLPEGRIGIEAIRALLTRLDNPHHRLPPVFHVAGTNGKGSTCAFLRAMLEAQGLTVHATTSPHLALYNERIRIAGQLIEDDDLAELLEEVLDAAEGLQLSFFETTIAASFLAFSRHPADACVIEVGLGGRFDATNVLERPAVCGIAALGIDHERFLLAPEEGTPEEPIARIAFEKASIAKTGVPLVTQAYPAVASKAIIDVAMNVGARTAIRDLDWSAQVGDEILYRDAQGGLSLPLPSLAGAHQADNAALAVAMLRHQSELHVSPDAIANGIRSARWPARLQQLGSGPLTDLMPSAEIILDGGHNPDAAHALAEALADRLVLNVIMGQLRNRNVEKFLRPLAPQIERLWAVPVPGHDHHDPKDVCWTAQDDLGIQRANPANNVQQALERLVTQLEKDGDTRPQTVLICGTLYLAGEVLRLNRELPD